MVQDPEALEAPALHARWLDPEAGWLRRWHDRAPVAARWADRGVVRHRKADCRAGRNPLVVEI